MGGRVSSLKPNKAGDDIAMKKVIIVTPHFPPSTLAGVHRARHMAKHLHSFGWNPHVLTVDPKFHAEKLDPDLARLVPDSVSVEHVRAYSTALGRRFGIGDITLRGYFFMRKALGQAIERLQPDLVFVTAAPFYFLLLAGRVQKTYKVPVVLDLQDPWVSEEGTAHSVLSRRGASHLLAKILEPRAVRHADAITSVSDVQNAQMRERYPFLNDTLFQAIPIGGDPEDFDGAGKIALNERIHKLDKDKVNFCFVGTFMPRSGPLMEVVFNAVNQLASRVPDIRSRLRLNFIGTSNQTSGVKSGPATELAKKTHISDMVVETTRRVPFLEALSILQEADALLLVGSDEEHYTASKIYPNLMSRTPYISLFHEQSSAHKILTRAGGGIQFSFSSADTLQSLETVIAKAMERIFYQPASCGSANAEAYDHVTAASIAEQFASLFDDVVVNA